MSVAKQRIQHLASSTKQQLIEFFGSLDRFYEVFYLIMQNEHQLDQYRPEGWNVKLQSVQFYRRLATQRVSSDFGIDVDLLEDIYSDYFEDFAQYKEHKTTMTNDEFVETLQKLVR